MSAIRWRTPKRVEEVEETGLACRAVQLLALFDKLKHPYPLQLPHAHKAFFPVRVTAALCLPTPMKPKGRVLPHRRLPELSCHRVVASQLRTLHDHLSQGGGYLSD